LTNAKVANYCKPEDISVGAVDFVNDLRIFINLMKISKISQDAMIYAWVDVSMMVKENASHAKTFLKTEIASRNVQIQSETKVEL
jgi:hypothetical protein